MSANAKPWCLITGAANGFGREFTRIFAREGYNVVLVDVQSDGLITAEGALNDAFPDVETVCIHCDLSEMDAARQVYDEVKARNLTINVLVNNAGLGEQGLFTESDWAKENAILHVNVVSLVYLTKLFMTEMVARNEGRILQLASVAAFTPVPKLSVYAASKAFVLSFSEALQHELKGTDVTLTILCPGASDTNFFRTAGAENTVAAQDTPLSDAAEVAQAGYDALMKGKGREVVGALNEFQVAMSNLLPDSWSAALQSRLFEKKDNDKETKSERQTAQ